MPNHNGCRERLSDLTKGASFRFPAPIHTHMVRYKVVRREPFFVNDVRFGYRLEAILVKGPPNMPNGLTIEPIVEFDEEGKPVGMTGYEATNDFSVEGVNTPTYAAATTAELPLDQQVIRIKAARPKRC